MQFVYESDSLFHIVCIQKIYSCVPNVSEFTYFLGGVSAESERECVASNEVTLAGLINSLLRAKVDLKETKTFLLSQSLSNLSNSVSIWLFHKNYEYDFIINDVEACSERWIHRLEIH